MNQAPVGIFDSGVGGLSVLAPTLELHISMLRSILDRAGVPLLEIAPRPYGYDFTCCLTHDVDFAGIRRHGLRHLPADQIAIRRALERRAIERGLSIVADAAPIGTNAADFSEFGIYNETIYNRAKLMYGPLVLRQAQDERVNGTVKLTSDARAGARARACRSQRRSHCPARR